MAANGMARPPAWAGPVAGRRARDSHGAAARAARPSADRPWGGLTGGGRRFRALALWFAQLVVGLVACFFGTLAQAQPIAVPAWQAPIMDQTGTLEAAQKTQLAQIVDAVAADQGAQIFVLVVPTTGEETVEQYARRVFDAWGIGRKGVDDGVLLLVARDDRQMRIDVGYGLEGAITDIQAGRIIREQMAPRFAQDDIYGGILAGVQALSALIQGEALPPPHGSTDAPDAEAIWMLLALILATTVMPRPIALLAAGVFTWAVTQSVLWGLLAAILGLALSALGHKLGWAQRLARAHKGGGGPGGGIGGGGGSGGGFGGGTSGGGGGGGRGGGGGASGGW